MIALGEGIAIAGFCVAAAPVAITAIKSKYTSNGNGKAIGITRELCDERHKSVAQQFAAVNEKLDLILGEVRRK